MNINELQISLGGKVLIFFVEKGILKTPLNRNTLQDNFYLTFHRPFKPVVLFLSGD